MKSVATDPLVEALRRAHAAHPLRWRRSQTTVPDPVVHVGYPSGLYERFPATGGQVTVEIARGVRSYDRRFRKGQRGLLRHDPYVGLRGYDHHMEVPFGGHGVPIDAVAVIEPGRGGGARRTPYRRWLAATGLAVLCPLCGGDLAAGAQEASGACPGGRAPLPRIDLGRHARDRAGLRARGRTTEGG